MADKTPSWIDYLNLGLTTAVGALGIYVAVNLGRSADQLGKNSLVVTSATFLLDDSPKRREAGMQIVSWLKDSDVALPPWEQDLMRQLASDSTLRPPSEQEDAPASASAPPPAQPAGASAGVARSGVDTIADQLFSNLGGASPRLFIQVPDQEQRDGADALRKALAQERLNSQHVIVPEVAVVGHAPEHVELRFLKKADQAEAQALANMLDGLIGQPVAVRDLSARYGDKPKIKPRTYELWFPHGEAIPVRYAAKE